MSRSAFWFSSPPFWSVFLCFLAVGRGVSQRNVDILKGDSGLLRRCLMLLSVGNFSYAANGRFDGPRTELCKVGFPRVAVVSADCSTR